MRYKSKLDRTIEEIEEAIEAHGELARADLKRKGKWSYGRFVRTDGDYAPLEAGNDNLEPLKKTG